MTAAPTILHLDENCAACGKLLPLHAEGSPAVPYFCDADCLRAKVAADAKAPQTAFCDECGSEPCSCHLCSNCGEETCSDACRAERRYYDAADEAYDRACDEGLQ